MKGRQKRTTPFGSVPLSPPPPKQQCAYRKAEERGEGSCEKRERERTTAGFLSGLSRLFFLGRPTSLPFFLLFSSVHCWLRIFRNCLSTPPQSSPLYLPRKPFSSMPMYVSRQRSLRFPRRPQFKIRPIAKKGEIWATYKWGLGKEEEDWDWREKKACVPIYGSECAQECRSESSSSKLHTVHWKEARGGGKGETIKARTHFRLFYPIGA